MNKEQQIKELEETINKAQKQIQELKEPKGSGVDWSKAPESAVTHVFEPDGTGWWFFDKPVLEGNTWCFGKISDLTKPDHINWKDSLEERPDPIWEDAPDWAEWYAVDESGIGCYFSSEPTDGHKTWIVDSCDLYETRRIQNWEKSKQRRPS